MAERDVNVGDTLARRGGLSIAMQRNHRDTSLIRKDLNVLHGGGGTLGANTQ